MSLHGRTFLITGAQQGIGATIAVWLGRHGANVAINYVDDADAANRVAGLVREGGGQAVTVAADVSHAEQVNAMVAAVRERFGNLDGLVNNAGIFPRAALVDIAEDAWEAVLRVNLKGTFLVLQATARTMIAQGQGGAIINISSAAAHAAPMGAHYSASKGGILSLTRTAAAELAPHRIRVNAIAPGLVRTAQPRSYWTDEEIDALGTRLLAGRVGEADDIAAAALFMLGDGASFMTGYTMTVDGGGT
jgi:NAD(P)-dependent dehydrogenase (short-subunit alcohol dehydrogenase family)